MYDHTFLYSRLLYTINNKIKVLLLYYISLDLIQPWRNQNIKIERRAPTDGIEQASIIACILLLNV